METITKENVNLRTQMRKLWDDHAMLTKMVIVSLVDNLEDVDTIHKNLRKNQEDIGNAIGRFFRSESISQHQKQPEYINQTPQDYYKILLKKSDYKSTTKLTPEEEKWLTYYQAGNMLTIMLKHRILHTMSYVVAKKTGDIPKIKNAENDLANNNVSVASFLSSINPNWSHEALENMLGDFLNFTLEEILARLDKNYDADLAAYGKVQEQVLKIADALNDGIVKQFPEQFGKEAIHA